MASQTSQRSAVSDVSFSLGLLSLRADLVPARLPNTGTATSFSYLCPDCPEPTKPEQKYLCEHGHGPYVAGEIDRRGKKIGDQLIEVTQEEIAAAKDIGVPDKLFEVLVFPAADVEAATVPDSGVYRIRPVKTADPSMFKMYQLFLEAASNKEVALIGEFALKGIPKMGRLSVFDGQLVVSTLVRPSDVADRDIVPVVEPTEKERAMFAKLIASVTEEFDPATFNNTLRERINALLEAKAADPGAVISTVAAAARPSSDGDLASLLEAMLGEAA